ncbi:MAG TPA: FtsX-like permease family protein [Acidimicrobiales bacterium]|nr:FtsX-like permease family protein [Acidimicrobiales bacterium]
MTGGWALALRMARRETRRRPGRTALVALLVGLPVAALATGLGLARTLVVSPAEARAAARGQADEVVGVEAAVLVGAAVEEVEAAAPPGTRIVAVASYPEAVETRDGGLEQWTVTDEPLDDPLLAGRYEILEGRPPEAPGEIAVHPRFAEDTGAGVGDTVDLLRLGPARVTGIVASPTSGPGDLVAARPLAPGPRPGHGTLFVDLPDGGRLGVLPDWLERFGPFEDGGTGSLRAAAGYGYGAAALGLALTGTIVAAAFAVGARRQMRTLGLLGATGLPPAALRRVMVLQGAVTGAVAGVAGVVVALGALALLHPRLPGWVDHPVGDVDVHAVDLVGPALLGTAVATLAAWGPAATAARVSVLAALAGRQGQRSIRPAAPAVGLAVAATGAAAVAGSAVNHGTVWGVIGTGGAVLVFGGGALATPWLVSRLEPLAAHTRGALRLAARGLARNRTRSGAVATAVMAPVAVAVFALTLVASERGLWDPGLGDDEVLVQGAGEGAGELAAAVRRLLPGAAEVPVRLVADPSVGGAAPLALEWGGDVWSDIQVASPEEVRAMGLPAAAAAALARGDVVARGDVPAGAPPRPALAGGPRTPDLAIPGVVRVGEDSGPLPDLVVSPEWVAARGLTAVDGGLLFRAPDPLTTDQRTALEAAGPDVKDPWIRSQVLGGPPPVIDAWLLLRDAGGPSDLRAIGGVLTGIVLGVTLVVVAAALALNAAENRDERDLLAALGAPPWAQRTATGWQAVLLPLAGAAVGAPLGLACAAAVRVARWASDDIPVHLRLPWVGVALLVVGVPAASGLAARVVASLTGRRHRGLSASLASD